MIRRWSVGGAFLLAIAAPMTARATASAELYRTESDRYGRYEARIRFAPGDGVVGAFFLWKVGSEAPAAYWNELDFEKVRADCQMQTNAMYGNPRSGTEQLHTMPSDMCDVYHDYGFEWTPTYIAWLIDGQEIRRDTGEIAAAFTENAGDGMRIHFNIWPGNADFGGNFDPAILPVRQYVSWVQYSSYQDGTFTLEWREEFDGSSLPGGWAVGDWQSPFNLSTHSLANVGFVNGIAVLSLTADDATGFDGVPPPDAGGVGGTAGGSTGGASTAGTGGATMGGSSGASTGESGGAGGAAGGNDGGASNSGAGGATMGGSSGASAGGSGVSAASGVGGATSAGGGGNGGSFAGAANPGESTAGGVAASAGATLIDSTNPPSDSGCGCRTASTRGSALGAGMVLFVLGACLRRASRREARQRKEVARSSEGRGRGTLHRDASALHHVAGRASASALPKLQSSPKRIPT